LKRFGLAILLKRLFPPPILGVENDIFLGREPLKDNDFNFGVRNFIYLFPTVLFGGQYAPSGKYKLTYFSVTSKVGHLYRQTM